MCWPLYRPKFLGFLSPTLDLSLIGERAGGPNNSFKLHVSRQFKNAATYSKKISRKEVFLKLTLPDVNRTKCQNLWHCFLRVSVWAQTFGTRFKSDLDPGSNCAENAIPSIIPAGRGKLKKIITQTEPVERDRCVIDLYRTKKHLLRPK